VRKTIAAESRTERRINHAINNETKVSGEEKLVKIKSEEKFLFIISSLSREQHM
jgi:hypothetical protein